MLSTERKGFEFSGQERAAALEILHQQGKKALTLSDLAVDNYSSYWLEILKLLHSRLGYGSGEGETVAIIDSGHTSQVGSLYPIDQTKWLDLTGEGGGDKAGHGSAISTLIGLTAPRAQQFHVKLLNAKGTIPGRDYTERVQRIRSAFDHVEKAGATMVNISWNYLTGYKEHLPHDYRPRHFSLCPICEILTKFVERTGIDVFVSEGNYFGEGMMRAQLKNRRQGDYSCPPAAPLVVPVVGTREGQPAYDTNLDTTCSVPAPSSVQLLPRNNGWRKRMRLFGRPATRVELTGTSFATPLAAGTYAAFKSAMRALGYPRLSIPRNFEGEPHTTPYNFSPELLFASPENKSQDRASRHTEWRVFYINTCRAAQILYEKGDVETAGELCCFVANLMAIPYRRMATWKYNVPLGEFILDAYIKGISLLHETRLASAAFDEFPRADEVIALMKSRGTAVADQQSAIEELRNIHFANLLQFLGRL